MQPMDIFSKTNVVDFLLKILFRPKFDSKSVCEICVTTILTFSMTASTRLFLLLLSFPFAFSLSRFSTASEISLANFSRDAFVIVNVQRSDGGFVPSFCTFQMGFVRLRFSLLSIKRST